MSSHLLKNIVFRTERQCRGHTLQADSVARHACCLVSVNERFVRKMLLKYAGSQSFYRHTRLIRFFVDEFFFSWKKSDLPASSTIRTMTVYWFSSRKLRLPPSHLSPPAVPKRLMGKSSFDLCKEELLMQAFRLMTKKKKCYGRRDAMTYGSADIKNGFPVFLLHRNNPNKGEKSFYFGINLRRTTFSWRKQKSNGSANSGGRRWLSRLHISSLIVNRAARRRCLREKIMSTQDGNSYAFRDEICEWLPSQDLLAPEHSFSSRTNKSQA